MTYASFARTTFLNMLGTLDGLAARADDAGMDDALGHRLTVDMFPLELQFRVALNQVLLALQQVGGSSVALETEAYRSLAELRQRIAALRGLSDQSDPATWAAAEAPVDLTLPNGVRFVMSSDADVRDWLIPNFYFHVTMAYALLRHRGLPLGKMDFLPHMAAHTVPAD